MSIVIEECAYATLNGLSLRYKIYLYTNARRISK